LLNPKIAYNTPDAMDIFETVRSTEWQETIKDFQKMSNSLKYIGKNCWSDMFNDVYNLTDAFCAGCNNHDSVLADTTKMFPLKKPVGSNYINTNTSLFDRYFGSAKVGICYTEDYTNCVHKLCALGIDTLVGFDYADLEMLSIKPELTNWSIADFGDLVKLGNVYLNGYVAFKVPNQESEIIRLLAISENNSYMSGMKLIFVCSNDVFVRTRGKYLSEIVNGPCIKSHILEDENV
jgi:ATP-dependent DNA helicase RecQ